MVGKAALRILIVQRVFIILFYPCGGGSLMSLRTQALVAVLCALAAHVVQAAPALSVVPLGPNPGNGTRDWLVKVAADPALFSDPPDNPDRGLGGSMALEMAFSVDDPVDLLNVVVADPASWQS